MFLKHSFELCECLWHIHLRNTCSFVYRLQNAQKHKSRKSHTSHVQIQYSIPTIQLCPFFFSSSLMNINCIFKQKHISGKDLETDFDDHEPHWAPHQIINSV